MYLYGYLVKDSFLELQKGTGVPAVVDWYPAICLM